MGAFWLLELLKQHHCSIAGPVGTQECCYCTQLQNSHVCRCKSEIVLFFFFFFHFVLCHHKKAFFCGAIFTVQKLIDWILSFGQWHLSFWHYLQPDSGVKRGCFCWRHIKALTVISQWIMWQYITKCSQSPGKYVKIVFLQLKWHFTLTCKSEISDYHDQPMLLYVQI